MRFTIPNARSILGHRAIVSLHDHSDVIITPGTPEVPRDPREEATIVQCSERRCSSLYPSRRASCPTSSPVTGGQLAACNDAVVRNVSGRNAPGRIRCGGHHSGMWLRGGVEERPRSVATVAEV